MLACLLWSTAFVAIKAGYESGIGPLLFAGLRFFCSGIILIPVARRLEGKGAFLTALRKHIAFIVLVGLFQTSITYSAFYMGVGLVPASVAAIVIGAQPLITSAVSRIVPPGERISARQWMFLFLGILGLIILSISRNPARTGPGFPQERGEIGGILLLVTALCASSVSSILVSRTRRDIPPLSLSSGQFLFGGAILLVLSRVLENQKGFVPDGTFYLALAWLMLVSAVGVSLWFWLLRVRNAGAGALSVWKFIIPVAGAVLGWLLMSGDNPDAGSVTGMALIAVSVPAFFLDSAKRLRRNKFRNPEQPD